MSKQTTNILKTGLTHWSEGQAMYDISYEPVYPLKAFDWTW